MTRTSLPGMHGRDIQPSAPTSNTAGCGDVGGTSQTACPCRVVPRPATWQLPNRADVAEIGTDAAQIEPNRSVSAISAILVNIGQRPIWPIRPKQAGICQNRPKSAVKISGDAEILTSNAFLALFFLCFVNQVY